VIGPSRLFSTSKCVLVASTINFIARSITLEAVSPDMPNFDTFLVFQEEQYHKNKPPNPFLEPFTATQHTSTPEHVTEFILMMLHRGYFDVAEFIISVIYITRFKEKTGLPLHISMWKPLFITALLLADKMWEDKSVKNSSLTMLFPVLSNGELFELEVRFLTWLGFNALVTRPVFQQYCHTLLLAESGFQEIAAHVNASEYATAMAQQDAAAGVGKPKAALPSTEGGGGGPQPPTAPNSAVRAQSPATAAGAAGVVRRAARGGAAAPAAARHHDPSPPPWNARKTLHAHSHSPVRRQLASSPTKGGHSPQHSDSDLLSSVQSPRRKPPSSQAPQAGSAPSLVTKATAGGSHQLPHTNSLGPGAAAGSSHTPRPRGATQPTLSAAAAAGAPQQQQAGAPLPPAHGSLGQGHDRRTNSEPRVALQPAANQGSAIRLTQGRPPPVAASMGGAGHRGPLAGRPNHNPIPSMASPRAKAEPGSGGGGGTMAADRSNSEPAVGRLANAAPQTPTMKSTGQGQAGTPGHIQAHSRSASHVTAAGAVGRQPQGTVTPQRLAFPGAPNMRSTLPAPGAASRVHQRPAVAQMVTTAQDQRVGRPMAQASGVPSNVANPAMLNRGRSSSPAGDGFHVQPPSARRNVAAPPPAMRPMGCAAGVRYG